MNRRAFLVSSFLLGVMHATGIKPGLNNYASAPDASGRKVEGGVDIVVRTANMTPIRFYCPDEKTIWLRASTDGTSAVSFDDGKTWHPEPVFEDS